MKSEPSNKALEQTSGAMRDRVAPLAAQRQCSADRKGPPTLLQDCGDHCTKSLVVVTAGETP